MGPRIAQMTMSEYGFSTDEDEKLVEGLDELALNEEKGQNSP
ncbi:hypothetical protein PSENEW3_00000520 [Picochlorum sp. SENEW3]|nr:hypothetical protein PSENEW3_00000520 [Picochlorum sp. SENEW3]